MAHALTPNSLKAFSKALLQERWGRGMVSCSKLLGVRFFVLEVRSWSGNNVPVNFCQTNVILCPDKKGQGPKAQLSPTKVPVLAKRRQISVGSSLGARFPHLAQLSSLRELGVQTNWPSGSSGCPRGRGRSHRLWPTQTSADIRSQRQGWGRGSTLLQGLGQG